MADVETGQEVQVVPYGENDYPLNEAEVAEDYIPTRNRGCTDIIFLIVFVLYVLGMAALSILSYSTGDPNRLLYGADGEGNLCGVDAMKSRPFVAYPRVEQDVLASGVLDNLASATDVKFYGVCMEECPKALEYVCTDAAEAAIDEQLLVSSPGTTRESIISLCLSEWPFTGLFCPKSIIHSECWVTTMDTTSVFFRCLPEYIYEVESLPESGCERYQNVTTILGQVKEICVVYKSVSKVTEIRPTASNILFDSFNTWAMYGNQLLGDVVKAGTQILVSGLGVSSGVGFLYVLSLWCCVGVVVWVTVFSSVLASVAFTLFCYIKAGIISTDILTTVYNTIANVVETTSEKLDDKFGDLLNNNTLEVAIAPINETHLPEQFAESLDYTQEYTYAAYGFTAFTVILVIIVFTMWSRIMRAIEIFQLASDGIRKNMLLVILPFVSMIFLCGVFALWAFCTAYVATAGSLETEFLNKTISLNANETIVDVKVFGSYSYTNLFVVYMFFGLLWVINFLNGVTVMTISGAVLHWFWADKVAADEDQHTHFPIARSFYNTLRYHLGTVAFGSIILAFIQFIRYLAAYLQQRMNKLEKDNKTLRILFCAVQCFLKCVQKCIEHVSRAAYIFTAMYGTNFCVSTGTAFVAITTNIAQVALVTFLGEIIQRFGQVLIAMLAGLTCWIWLDNDPAFAFGGESQLNSYVFPVLISMFLAWFTAAEVLSVYDITVDTILLSFCQDKRLQAYKENYKPVAHEGMEEFIGRHELKDAKLIRQASLATIH